MMAAVALTLIAAKGDADPRIRRPPAGSGGRRGGDRGRARQGDRRGAAAVHDRSRAAGSRRSSAPRSRSSSARRSAGPCSAVHGIDLVAALNRDVELRLQRQLRQRDRAPVRQARGVPRRPRPAEGRGSSSIVVHLLWRTWRGYDWIAAAGWTLLAISVTSTWLLAWYILWPLPLAVVSRDRRLLLATLAVQAPVHRPPDDAAGGPGRMSAPPRPRSPTSASGAGCPSGCARVDSELPGRGELRLVEGVVLVLVGLLLAVATVDDVARQAGINHRLDADLRSWRRYTHHDYKNVGDRPGTARRRDRARRRLRQRRSRARRTSGPRSASSSRARRRGGLRTVAGGWYLPAKTADDVRSSATAASGPARMVSARDPAKRG